MYQVETGQSSLKSVRFDLPSFIEDIAQSIAIQALNRDVEVISFIDPSIPDTVKGDPDRMHQLLMSLVGYAVKCINHGDVLIQAKVEKETKSSSCVNFSISFIGTTAFAYRQQAIQECIDDVDNPLSPESYGVDSELFISQQLLMQMGSTIQVINFPEKESKITFTIKFKRDTQAKKIEPAIDFTGIRVLLVDDNLTSQLILTKMLNSIGCSVKTVASGAEVHPALVRGLITNAPFRVVLLDMEMPIMDGESVLRAIHQDDLTRNTKVIVLLPIRHRNNPESISEFDYSNYLLKPVRRSELFNALRSILGLRQDAHRENNTITREEVSEPQHGPNLKILLVEDNELNIKMGSILLSHLGHTVDVASSGAEAVAAIETRDYDLVFMDVQMPEMSGLEASRRIRALKNDRKNVPIIAMTAHDITKYEQLCLEAGMNDFVSKPFELKRINQIITACAEGGYKKGLKTLITPETILPPVDAPILDVTVGMPVFDNDAIQYANFLEEYLEGLPKRLEKMVVAMNAEEWEALGNEAHKLKGISANLGAMQVSNLAAQLEVRSGVRTEEPDRSILGGIADAISKLVDQAPNLLSKLRSS